jgi:hypothetical protein
MLGKEGAIERWCIDEVVSSAPLIAVPSRTGVMCGRCCAEPMDVGGGCGIYHAAKGTSTSSDCRRFAERMRLETSGRDRPGCWELCGQLWLQARAVQSQGDSHSSRSAAAGVGLVAAAEWKMAGATEVIIGQAFLDLSLTKLVPRTGHDSNPTHANVGL